MGLVEVSKTEKVPYYRKLTLSTPSKVITSGDYRLSFDVLFI